ncbi:MAG: hypothetical protein HYY44_03790 [Deltaproteobacteria bacterium]|nr:hypothetical protein [Deltaproteobacteria bacterium]MBI4374155.1 hypothetical protein [Deltaproteobacteria bacterium]
MREPVNLERILQFLQRLGKEVHFPCKIYLVGGTSLVYFGLREQTIDIDLALDVDNAHHQKLIEMIRRLKEELNLNIEEASPGDFIPLPAGWSDRCPFIGTFGPVTAFHFDLYSTSLCKIERGTEVDFEDVKALLKSGKINREKLNSFYQEILPRYGEKSLKQDPARIRRNFEILGSQLKQN